MAATGRHAYRPSASRRTLFTVAAAGLVAIALAVGFGSDVANRFFSPDDGLSALAGPPPATASVATTELSASPTITAATPPAVTVGPTKPAPSAPPVAPAPTKPPPESLPDVAQALLDQINSWRAADGKSPLTMTSGLVASAHAHNVRMSAGCGMQHQCTGEASLGARISAQGISWRAVAENIAWHSSVQTSGVLAAAKGLNESMHNETPPDDGHRRNMLNDAYHRIGIDVIRDADGKVWLTEDFAN